MRARVKKTSRHNEAGRTLDSTIRHNGLDRLDVHTAAQKAECVETPSEKRDRYALMAEAETRRVYREFRQRQVAFKRQQVGAVA